MISNLHKLGLREPDSVVGVRLNVESALAASSFCWVTTRPLVLGTRQFLRAAAVRNEDLRVPRTGGIDAAPGQHSQ